MKQAVTGDGAAALERLTKRVAVWREQREHPRSRVPQDLWNEAIAMARIRGVYQTAKAIGFGYSELKARVDNAANVQLEREQTAFIEVQMPTVPPSVGQARMVVELTSGRGRRMRIEVSDARSMDLGGLAEAFWRGEP
jgi:hypothetical protein